jgi:hypothetical protein
MIFATICIIVVLSSYVQAFWAGTFERETRWRIYALRDELRWAAVEDKSLLESDLFWHLDRFLTDMCTYVEYLSLWTIVPLWAMSKGDKDAENKRAELRRTLSLPENACLASIYDRAASIMLKWLVGRHIVVTAIARAVVGLSRVSKFAEWVVSSGGRPLKAVAASRSVSLFPL